MCFRLKRSLNYIHMELFENMLIFFLFLDNYFVYLPFNYFLKIIKVGLLVLFFKIK